MQPYQESSEEIKRQGQAPLTAAKTAGSLGLSAATAYLGGNVVNRVLPFLSKYIPENLVKKGLEKIDPRYGKFIDKALAAGQSMDDIKEFIGQKIEQHEESAEEKRNIIEQEFPELHNFIDQEIKKGRSSLQAGALAFNDKRFTQAINKLKNQHKLNWSTIIENVYGKDKMALPQQKGLAEEAMQPEGSMPTKPPSAEQQAVNQPSQGQQQGKGSLNDETLLKLFADVLKM